MALITCHECGNQVSATARSCPQCGAKGKALSGPPQTKHLGLSGKLMIGAIVSAAAITAMATNQNHPPSPPQQAEQDKDSARTAHIVLYAKSLKTAARDPDSVVFERVLANRDGTMACFKYRARNGFGGTNREWAAFTPAGGADEGPAVKAICHDKVMEDVTSAAVPLIKAMA